MSQDPTEASETSAETVEGKPSFDFYAHPFKKLSTEELERVIGQALAQVVENEHGIRVAIGTLEFTAQLGGEKGVAMTLTASLRRDPNFFGLLGN